jgi:hypothetical protein
MTWHIIFTLLTILVGFKNKIKLETASSIFLFWWSIHAMEESNQRDTHFLFFRFNGGLSHFLVLCFVCLFVFLVTFLLGAIFFLFTFYFIILAVSNFSFPFVWDLRSSQEQKILVSEMVDGVTGFRLLNRGNKNNLVLLLLLWINGGKQSTYRGAWCWLFSFL